MCFYIYMLISKFKFIFIFIWIYIILYRIMLYDIIYIYKFTCLHTIDTIYYSWYLSNYLPLSVPAGSPSPLPSAEMKRSQSMPSAQLKHIGSRGSQRWWNDQLWMGRNPAAVHGLSHVYRIIYRLSTIHHYKFGGMEVSIVVGVPQ